MISGTEQGRRARVDRIYRIPRTIAAAAAAATVTVSGVNANPTKDLDRRSSQISPTRLLAYLLDKPACLENKMLILAFRFEFA